MEKEVEVIGAGNTTYIKIIQIDETAWESCDEDVRNGVLNILARQPIRILSASGKGNGIKLESKGLEFHTQTNKRLQAPGCSIKTLWILTVMERAGGTKADTATLLKNGE